MDILSDLNNGMSCGEIAKKYSIKYKFYKDTPDRVLFHSTRKSDVDANGLIFEKAEKWKQVCFPLAAFSRQKIDNRIKYKIFPIREGTVINRYYSDGWKMATRCSSDILREQWRGYKYADILARFNFDDSDISRTYIYIFTAPEFHYTANSLKLIATRDAEEIIYHDEELNISLEHAKKYKGVILRSKKLNFIIENDENRERRKTLYEPFFCNDYKINRILRKKNSEKYFVEAKCFLLGRIDKFFGEFKEEKNKIFDCCEKILTDFIAYTETRLAGNLPVLDVDTALIFENFYDENYNFLKNFSRFTKLRDSIMELKSLVFLLVILLQKQLLI